jgi:hypothetical protein
MPEKLVEVCRSYSRKINIGNFQSKDLFCSQKLEVPESEAEEASKKAIHFCMKIVDDEADAIIQEHLPADQKVIEVDKGMAL